MVRCFSGYWTIIVPPKTLEETIAEAYLFVWRRWRGGYGHSPWAAFRRWHLFVAVFCVQAVCGSMWSVTSALSQPLEVHFYGSPNTNKVVNVLYTACTAMGIAAAFAGPALERRGPRWGMTAGTSSISLGYAIIQIAVATTSQGLLYTGAVAAGGGFGLLMLVSTCTAQKWCPDLRGVVTGISCFSWGIGSAVFDSFFRTLVALPSLGLSVVFTIFLASILPVLVLCSLVLRTPPPSFQVHGKNMHSIPVASAPSAAKVQDEFLNVGMTLVNYDIVRRSSGSNDLEGTDRRYFEQVQALTLVQCIASTDFLCLYVAFGATATAGLVYIELHISSDDAGNLRFWYPALSAEAAQSYQVTCLWINWASRLAYPMLSDLLIRVLYANPAFARKLFLWALILAQAIALLVSLRGDAIASDVAVFVRTTYVLRVATGGGASLIICLLTDMYGVYNMGTMYGLIITSWSLGMVVVSESFSGDKDMFVTQIRALAAFAVAGSLLMVFVRTNSKDRFFRGYQLTVFDRVLVQLPWFSPTASVDGYHDVVLLSPDRSSIFMWSSEDEMDYRPNTRSLSV
ncbi:major Facilitator Superfamily (MFS) [Achlya hypogyna]|uniref:Major Facilitator Superfamily (MFS) n=1 Tax=Achlya hypogyna TaxID=1202772 RepID=A0A1V9ZJA1_ACHHY|nr:major Facilitator Superfamily (MFS) [Achlya hypogyna]